MAEKVVSPGVFTVEKDISFIAQGVSAIGASVIGPTLAGPALVPVAIESINEFYARFGYSTPDSYVPRTVESYLQNSGVVNVVRVLGASVFGATVWNLASSGSLQNSGSDRSIGVLTATYGNAVTSLSVSSSGNGDFVVNDGVTSYSCSINPTSANYFTKVFGTSPFGSKKLFLLYANKNFASSSYYSNTSTVSVRRESAVGGDSFATQGGFSHGITPWIQSQNIAGSKYDLFRFHTIGDGTISNKQVKVGIQDIKVGTNASNYFGSFTLVVRAVNGTMNSQDLDRRPEVLETFDNLSLDPDSSNYILKRIGDKYASNQVVDGLNRIVTSGSYDNLSAYVRVEAATTSNGAANNLDGLPAEALPYGFKALSIPVPSGLPFPDVVLATTQSIDGVYDSRRFHGFDFEWGDNVNYLTFIPTGGSTSVSFSLDDITVPTALVGAPYYGTLANITGSVAQRKFAVPFQGGFDGLHVTQSINTGDQIISTNVFGFDCSTGVSVGTLQYKKALDAIANAEEIDTNLIVLPGILYQYHTQVCLYAKNICESRGDAFYIMDGFRFNSSVVEAISTMETSPGELDSNYTAVYYPWVKVIESSTSKPIWVPPSVVMPGVFAFNDRVAYEWFAPAGMNRGGLTEVIEAKSKINHNERDDLYEARINPIATFPQTGPVAWGQKTLQVRPSALDRINVRRLLINLKKFVASTSRYLVFEQNTSATRNRFLNIVNPYMASVQQKAGLYAFKVVMDETNNTADVIDRNIMYGQIYLKPTKTAEFIVVDFNILPTGATFPNA